MESSVVSTLSERVTPLSIRIFSFRTTSIEGVAFLQKLPRFVLRMLVNRKFSPKRRFCMVARKRLIGKEIIRTCHKKRGALESKKLYIVATIS